MRIELPSPCVLALIGPSGAGKSTFARRHFRPTEVLSSDLFRGMVCDDESDQSVSSDAFEILHLVAAKRLAHRKLAVVDATNVQPQARRNLTSLASRFGARSVAMVFALPSEVYTRHNQARPDRVVPDEVILRQLKDLQDSLPGLHAEGWDRVEVFHSLDEVAETEFLRLPPAHLRLGDHGPFDLIGDVHGCFDELMILMRKLGYAIGRVSDRWQVVHPRARKLVFVGDLVDRGPKVVESLQLVMDLMDDGTALCVVGNHDDKLLRWLRGNRVTVAHGLADSIAQIEPQPPTFKERAIRFLAGLEYHYVLDDGNLVVAHAGLKEAMHGKLSRSHRSFAIFGDVSGEVDEMGAPVRGDWGADYKGTALVVHGHTPNLEPRWANQTVNIDTGCVFGNKLTALRYPEREIVSVPAARIYQQPRKVIGAAERSA
jgi:protein phosphatase